MIYLELFWTFFKIGAFTFGGGYAMLPLIQEEVLHHNWASIGEILNFIAVSESTPGPFAVNIATYIGVTLGGLLGAFFATLGVILPSFLIILVVAAFFRKYSKNKSVKGIMSGLRPAVIGLIASAIISVASTEFFPQGLQKTVFFDKNFYILLFIFLLSAVLVFKKLHPIFVILISGVLGIIFGFWLNL
ncbi:MAG: chromate transporter [Firmicutes bacterium]|nr:chromate transporter [Bacillota bacterium]